MIADVLLHVFEFGGYGIIAADKQDALDTLRDHEGDDVADYLVDSGVRPTELPDTEVMTLDMSDDEDDESRFVTRACAEWVASVDHEILWRTA